MTLMKFYAGATRVLFACAILAGCASTTVTRRTPMTARGLARPNQIWVYDFVATFSDMPTNSSLAGRVGAQIRHLRPKSLKPGANTAR